MNLRVLRGEHTVLVSEITSLKQRRSNITAEQVAMRARMCASLKEI